MAENNGSMLAPLHAKSKVKRVIGVVSGKGGVGKSFVTASLAAAFAAQGKRTAVLDADITGPSIPRCFGLKGRAMADQEAIYPVVTKTGIQVMSVNLLLEQEEAPVVWRGPIIAGTVTQFWSEVLWDDVEVMLVDMPPGTGDVPLTVFQSLPVDGIVIVTSPQELVGMIVKKAVNMANTMSIPVLGIVENYSYFKCPDCGKIHFPFGEGKTDAIAAQYGIPVIGRVPMDPAIAGAMDFGVVEDLPENFLADAASTIGYLLDAKADKQAAEAKEEIFAFPLNETDDDKIFPHFGKAPRFAIVNTYGGEVQEKKIIETADLAHDHTGLAAKLREEGAKILICGGIGGGAQDGLAAGGISVIPGVMGTIDAALANYFAGNLHFSKEASCDCH